METLLDTVSQYCRTWSYLRSYHGCPVWHGLLHLDCARHYIRGCCSRLLFGYAVDKKQWRKFARNHRPLPRQDSEGRDVCDFGVPDDTGGSSVCVGSCRTACQVHSRLHGANVLGACGIWLLLDCHHSAHRQGDRQSVSGVCRSAAVYGSGHIDDALR